MDLTTKLQKLDRTNVFGSIQGLPDQIDQVVQDISRIDFPENYRDADLLAISGMGGSIYSYYVLDSLCREILTKPLIKLNDYILPKSINKNTLFIASSYSGETEETLKNTYDAASVTRKITAITTGGSLSKIMDKEKFPFYKIYPKFNPSGQPRVGLGYMIFGLVLILAHLDLINLDLESVKQFTSSLRANDKLLQSKALEIIEKIRNRTLIFVSSEHLSGNAHISRNQINETSKTFAEYHIIPELNHHLMEGLTFPRDNKLFFIFFESSYFGQRNIKRIEVTKEILKKQNIDFQSIRFETIDKIQEFMFFLQFGSYLSLFLGLEYDQDPSLIPFVDYFKNVLENQ